MLFQDSSSTKLYKNIFFLICIILFIFFLSNEKNINELFVQKESMKYIFLIIIIYLSFYQMNLSFVVIPLSLFFIMKHPKFPSMISSFQQSFQSIFHTNQKFIPNSFSSKEIEYKENIENVENIENDEKEIEVKNENIQYENKINNQHDENDSEIRMDELQELYMSIKKELEEMDSKPI